MKKHYTPQQKAQLVLELLQEEKTVAQLAVAVVAEWLVNWQVLAVNGAIRT